MKKFVALFLTLALMCGLVACGSGSGGSSDGGSDSKDEGGSDGKVSLNVIAAQYGQNTTSWWEGFVKERQAERKRREERRRSRAPRPFSPCNFCGRIL